ncbi:MAG: CBS domain-containing protein [Planctomycetes bacterium]|nr:CBS domain-containing protein [Planctomycetota bacterium]
MNVNEIMTCNAETIDSQATLAEAAQKMKQLDVGALPVWESGELAGMITDRDIAIRGVALAKDPTTTRVNEVMTPEVFYCFADDDIHEAAELMEEKNIHRLLVLDESNEPAGFVSLADFAVKSRDERLAWEILEKISEPACPQR